MIISRKLLYVILGLFIAVPLVYNLSKPYTTHLAGQLHDGNNQSVKEGYYDLKLTAYSQTDGKQVIDKNFSDVFVKDGQYQIDLNLPKFTQDGLGYMQVCRSSQPSQLPDGIADQIYNNCNDSVAQNSVFTEAECPQQVSIKGAPGVSAVFGNRIADIFGSCVAKNAVASIAEIAPSKIETPSIVVSQAGNNNVPLGGVGLKGDQGEKGTDGKDGLSGAAGENGVAGAQGPAGPEASDNQTLGFNTGTRVLSVSNGNSVNLSSIDTLAGLSCVVGQIVQWNGSAWVCANPAAGSDSQTISLAGSNLSILNGNTVSLAGFLDNTDAQSIAIAANILSISGNASTVNLAPYLDNTDSQTVSFNTGTSVLSISGGNTANLSSLLDNTDSQAISKTGNTLSITGSAGTVDLSGYLDNTDVLASLSCALNQIAKWNGSAWICASDSGITSEVDGVIGNEVTDATASGGLTRSGVGTNVSPYTLGIGSAAVTNAMLANSGLTITAGAGLTGGGSVVLGGTVTVSSAFGASIDNSEITDGTITFADIGANSCSNNQIFKFNGTAWFCGTDIDTDTVLNEAQVEAYIFDVDNTGTLSSGTLALGSLSYTGTLSDTNIADALTVSAGGSVADGALSANVTKLGSSIESSEITDGTVIGTDIASATILFNNIAQNGCGLNNIMKWNGSAWACAVDATGGTVNSFETITTTSGTAPVADSSTDTLTLSAGSGVTITGDGTTDTITVAATLGADITSAEIVDGTIANADLANSSVTVTAGTGLIGGGTVSLGGTVTLNSSLGTAIDSSEITNGTIVTADIAADTITSALILNGEIVNADIADGTIANAKLVNSAVTITAGTGLSGGGAVALGSSISLTSTLGTAIDTSEITDGTILFADLASNSCGSNQIIKWNGSAWTCANDNDSAQNLFDTISAPGGTNSIADGTSDTLAFANGSGITITSDGTTDTITVAATLGVSIDSAEIVDSTITGTDIAAGTVANSNLANSSVTVTAGTGLSGGGAVSLGGSVTLNSSLGTEIDTGEITDGTIVLADFSNFGCGSTQIIKYNGSAWACSADNVNDADADATNELQNLFFTIATPAGTSPAADSQTDTLTLANGAGVTITGDGTTDTITIATTLGTSVDSSEITDATITGTDIAAGTVANSNLANSSVTVTAGTGLTGGGAVSLGGTVTLNSALGTAIDTSEITDGTILFADLGQNGCSTNQIPKWNGSAWACAADVTGSSINSFETFTTTSGTSPVADSSTDTLTLTAGTGITVTGDSTTDTISLAAVLGTDITSAEIVDGTIANADLANSSLTVTAGTGLTGGGAVSLGGTVTLNLANDFGASIDSTEITNGTIAAVDVASNVFTQIGLAAAQTDASTNSMVFLNKSGASGNLAQLQVAGTNKFLVAFDGTIDTASVDSVSIVDASVANADLVNSSITVTSGSGLITGGSVSLGGTVILDVGAGTGITVNANDIAITADGLNYTELSDTLTLDATTTSALSTFNIVTNLDSTGDVIYQDAGATFFTIDDTGGYAYTLDATDNPAYTVTNAGSSNVTTNLSGTGDFIIQDNGATVLSVLDNGTFLFKNSANSASSFSVQNATATNLFVIDTTNSRVYIGDPTADATGALLVLDTKNTAGDPTGVAGAMYYNSSTGTFRCFENSAWRDCLGKKRVFLTADVTNNNGTANTIADVTGLSFPVISGSSYGFECSLWYTSAATTTGSRWSINGPTTSTLSYNSHYPNSATTIADSENFSLATYDLPAASSTASPLSSRAGLTGRATFTANGSVIVRFASEVAASAIVAKTNSWCDYWVQ